VKVWLRKLQEILCGPFDKKMTTKTKGPKKTYRMKERKRLKPPDSRSPMSNYGVKKPESNLQKFCKSFLIDYPVFLG